MVPSFPQNCSHQEILVLACRITDWLSWTMPILYSLVPLMFVLLGIQPFKVSARPYKLCTSPWKVKWNIPHCPILFNNLWKLDMKGHYIILSRGVLIFWDYMYVCVSISFLLCIDYDSGKFILAILVSKQIFAGWQSELSSLIWKLNISKVNTIFTRSYKNIHTHTRGSSPVGKKNLDGSSFNIFECISDSFWWSK